MGGPSGPKNEVKLFGALGSHGGSKTKTLCPKRASCLKAGKTVETPGLSA